MQKARWSTAVAAAALLALPVAASAQSTQSAPQQNPPSQQQPTTTPQQPPTTTPEQPPTTAPQQPPATTAQQPPAGAAASGQVDESAAKTHLSQARDTLSQITSMPEAAKLQGAARTQVSQLISDFNALITTQSDWRSSYAKVDSDLDAILGPDANASVGTSGVTGTAGATGTAGSASAAPAPAAGNAQVDPAIRAKLVEFRTHLNEFEKAAGGTMPPSAATPSTASPSNPGEPSSMNPSNPSNPSSAANPANPTSSPVDPSANPTTSPTGTSGVSSSSPTATMDPASRANAETAVNSAAGSNAEAQKELDAISSILERSKTGTLTKTQTAELKKHVENLRALISK